jgi:methionyl-tRNA formyltransferase
MFYIGSSGPLSTLPLEWLLGSEHTVCGVGLDRQESVNRSGLSLALITGIETNPLASIAKGQNIPVVGIAPINQQQNLKQIEALAPDLILVSCFAQKLSDELLAIPSQGSLNCHPSLLPAYRGPVPLFWQYRQGVESLGMSVHRMTAEWDAGDIVASQSIAVEDGLSAGQINQRLAECLVELLAQTLVTPWDHVSIPQDKALASYYSYPQETDFIVSVEWPARRIFNFMRATEHWGRAYPCEVAGQRYQLKHALAYVADSGSQLPDTVPNVLNIACSQGILTASYYQ